jgi:hypothetical protein
MLSTLCVFSDRGDGVLACPVCGLVVPAFAKNPVAVCEPRLAPVLLKESDGPGRELKALLKDWLGIEATPTCSCNKMAAKMDLIGPEWCESDKGMVEILGVMRDEHAKRWADGRTILPWTDAGARQLVLLACRRARAKAG